MFLLLETQSTSPVVSDPLGSNQSNGFGLDSVICVRTTSSTCRDPVMGLAATTRFFSGTGGNTRVDRVDDSVYMCKLIIYVLD